jgi:hypothetical protein
VPGVVVDGTGTLRLDPAVALIGIANPIGPGITASSLPMPHAEANSAPLGGVLTASLDGPAGSLGALSVALPGTPGPIPGLGDPLFWELVTAVPQVAGVLAVGQPLTSTIAVPNVPALAGVAVVHHGFTWEPVGGLQVSNPAAAVVH